MSALHELLQQPFALDDLGQSPLPMVTAELSGDALAEDAAESLGHLLRSARAVSVAVVPQELNAQWAPLASAFDILLAPEDLAGEAMVPIPAGGTQVAIDKIEGGIATNPAAAVTLVELLRVGAYHSVPQGLVAESLAYSTLQSGPEFARWLSQRGPAVVPADPEPPLLVERDGTSLNLTLNRPHRANAFTAALRDELIEALRVAATDPAVSGVILRGAGNSFSSGGDLAEFGSTPDPATAHATRVTRSPAWWVDHLRADVRVHLHGACIGAGIEIAAFAGTVIAEASTTVRLPEIAMGLIPGAGGTVSLPRRIGPQRTAYLAISGDEISAYQALQWGVVDRVSPAT